MVWEDGARQKGERRERPARLTHFRKPSSMRALVRLCLCLRRMPPLVEDVKYLRWMADACVRGWTRG